MRKTFTAPLAIAIASGVLAAAGCGDDVDGGADGFRGQARQAEPEHASADAEPRSPELIAFYVNGKPYQQDPRAIELTDRKEIAIVIGTPPPRIPNTADFSSA